METTSTTKGQIVIPSSIRKRLGIKEGTKIRIEVNEQKHQIILKPITPELIRKFRGILKLKSGQKSASQQLLEDRAKDIEKEEAKLGRYRTR